MRDTAPEVGEGEASAGGGVREPFPGERGLRMSAEALPPPGGASWWLGYTRGPAERSWAA